MIQPSDIEPRSRSSSTASSTWRPPARHPRPAAIAKQTSVPAPVTIATAARARPDSVPPASRAGNAASSRRRRRRGRPAAAKPECAGARRYKRRPAEWRGRRTPVECARAAAADGWRVPAPNGDRQDQRERCDAKKLDQKIGDNGPRYPEHVAYRCIGGMAERRVVHRPGRESEREQGRDQEQRESPSSRSLRRNASRNASGRKVKRSRPRSIAGMLPLSPAPRRDDAAPVPWFLGPAPWRRECSRGPDWSHRPGPVPDSGPV